MSTIALTNDAILAPAPSRARIWAGRILTGLLGAFLVVDAVMKLLKVPAVMEASAKLGFTASSIVAIGALLLACTTLYLVPRTAVVGAVLLTGYFGGAICLHVHIGAPAFNIVFAVVFGALTWFSLYLRGDDRVLAIVRAARA